MGAGLDFGLLTSMGKQCPVYSPPAILPPGFPYTRPSSVGLPVLFFEPKSCSISVTGNE